MALESLDYSFNVEGGGVATRTVDLASVQASYLVGDGTTWPDNTTSYEVGTGNSQANQVFTDIRTVAATTNDDIDLTIVPNAFGEECLFTKAKIVYIDIDTPDGTKVLRVGPLGVTNAFVGWLVNAGATTYEEVFQRMLHEHPFTGWTVSGTQKILRVYNPGASAVTYRITVIGVS